MTSPLTKSPSRIINNSELENLSMKYKHITSTLPKIDSPYAAVALHHYKGFWLPLVYLEATLSMKENFKAQPCDIYLCGLPKVGSTWLKTLVFSIMSRDLLNDSTNNPILNNRPHELVPTLENDYVTNPTLLDSAKLPLFTTHLPYSLLPPSILESNCKILYLCREPKENFVSTWHFAKKLKYGTTDMVFDLDTEFKRFCQGICGYGPYWDHVTEYWKASVDRPDKVFFFNFHDMKNDTSGYVKKFAEFLGKPLTKDEESQGIAEKIVEICHFKNLSTLEVNNSGSVKASPLVSMDNNAFFRKGGNDNWKNTLTEDMAKSIDQVIQEKFQSLGVTFPISSPPCKGITNGH